MKIYKKAVIVAMMEVPDNLTQDQIEETESDFEGQLYRTIDGMQEGWSCDFDYKWNIYNVEDSADGQDEKEELEAV